MIWLNLAHLSKSIELKLKVTISINSFDGIPLYRLSNGNIADSEECNRSFCLDFVFLPWLWFESTTVTSLGSKLWVMLRARAKHLLTNCKYPTFIINFTNKYLITRNCLWKSIDQWKMKWKLVRLFWILPEFTVLIASPNRSIPIFIRSAKGISINHQPSPSCIREHVMDWESLFSWNRINKWIRIRLSKFLENTDTRKEWNEMFFFQFSCEFIYLKFSEFYTKFNLSIFTYKIINEKKESITKQCQNHRRKKQFPRKKVLFVELQSLWYVRYRLMI